MQKADENRVNDANELKRVVAMAAIKAVPDHSIVGLGSGSTLEFFIRALGRCVREGRLHVVGVPTSLQARLVGKEAGIPILDPMEADGVDVAVDGADEVDGQGNLIKGGGAAHVTEKIVAAQAKRFVVIVDESKLVTRLGEKFPVPVEVLAPALPLVLRQLKALGSEPKVRTGSGKIGPVISESGHVVVDAKFDRIDDPSRLDRELNMIPGVVGHGIFIGLTSQVLVSRRSAEGVSVETMNFK